MFDDKNCWTSHTSTRPANPASSAKFKAVWTRSKIVIITGWHPARKLALHFSINSAPGIVVQCTIVFWITKSPFLSVGASATEAPWISNEPSGIIIHNLAATKCCSTVPRYCVPGFCLCRFFACSNNSSKFAPIVFDVSAVNINGWFLKYSRICSAQNSSTAARSTASSICHSLRKSTYFIIRPMLPLLVLPPSADNCCVIPCSFKIFLKFAPPSPATCPLLLVWKSSEFNGNSLSRTRRVNCITSDSGPFVAILFCVWNSLNLSSALFIDILPPQS